MVSTNPPHVDPSTNAIVIVAKCPFPGFSKTRLIPLFGMEGSARLAKAMLSDTMITLTNYKLPQQFDDYRIILYYTPGNDDGRIYMENLIKSLPLSSSTTANKIELLPMMMLSSKDHLPNSSDLGYQLSNAIRILRDPSTYNLSGCIMFLGMDTPILPLDEIDQAFRHPTMATLCPTFDGGYGMLCLPSVSSSSSSSVPSSSSYSGISEDKKKDNHKHYHSRPSQEMLFSNILWSHPLTAICQLKALTDHNIPIRIGRIMQDIDEPKDVWDLYRRKNQKTTMSSIPTSYGILEQSTVAGDIQDLSRQDSECPYTISVLEELLVSTSTAETIL
jgi:glycosyltransferase A (GT-A) superfamily protein (DUF2064 family)